MAENTGSIEEEEKLTKELEPFKAGVEADPDNPLWEFLRSMAEAFEYGAKAVRYWFKGLSKGEAARAGLITGATPDSLILAFELGVAGKDIADEIRPILIQAAVQFLKGLILKRIG